MTFFTGYKKTVGVVGVVLLMSAAFSFGSGLINRQSDVLPYAGIFLCITALFLGVWGIFKLLQGGSEHEKGKSSSSDSGD